jgi:hypothetical protein
VTAVRVTQLDGKLPNLALMRLAAWHRHQGDDVRWERGATRQLHEPEYDIVYASAIFETSSKAVAKFRRQFPDAIIGGSGGDSLGDDGKAVKVSEIVPSQFSGLDYSAYPEFHASIGYASRGCRFKCRSFCMVPDAEGAGRSAGAIGQIWRGPGFPKDVHLLDNDFFGNPDWRSVVEEVVSGGYRICINQGINMRLLAGHPWNVPKSKWTPELIAERERLADEQVEALVAMKPWDDQFKRRRIYAAWDNLGDEAVFMAGLDRLERHGIAPEAVMVYMLVGLDPRETWERILYRHGRLVERGVRPYPMPFHKLRFTRPDHYRALKRFQSWAVSPAQKACSFGDFRADHKAPPSPGPLLGLMTPASRLQVPLGDVS